MKKILVLLYDKFVGYEIILATTLLKSRYEIITAAPEIGPFTESSGLLINAHLTLDEVNIEDYEAVIIPGGIWHDLLANCRVTELLKLAHQQGKVLGAICAAPIHLAKAGILQDRQYTTSLDEEEGGELFEWENWLDEPVVIDGNIITAKGNAYLEFAFALADLLGLYTETNQEERENDFKYLKNAL